MTEVAVEEQVRPTIGTDNLRHAHCLRCQPTAPDVVALCGSPKVVRLPHLNWSIELPPNACVVCADLWMKRCGRCGR